MSCLSITRELFVNRGPAGKVKEGSCALAPRQNRHLSGNLVEVIDLSGHKGI
jgi:hypothetical protein